MSVCPTLKCSLSSAVVTAITTEVPIQVDEDTIETEGGIFLEVSFLNPPLQTFTGYSYFIHF